MIAKTIPKLFMISDDRNKHTLDVLMNTVLKYKENLEIIKVDKENSLYKYGLKRDDQNNLISNISKLLIDNDRSTAIILHDDYLGISIEANKINNIKCSVCSSVFEAKATKDHNDSNMLVLSVSTLGEEIIKEIVEAYVTTDFLFEEKHLRRVKKLDC
jgi:RpiB/LacA/LacB family sugar-phosphate isomerase